MLWDPQGDGCPRVQDPEFGPGQTGNVGAAGRVGELWLNNVKVFVSPFLFTSLSPALRQLARNVGNWSFNEIMEASLPSPKPTASSDM